MMLVSKAREFLTNGEILQAGRFLVVGTSGFIADVLVLMAVIRYAGLDPVLARAFSFPPAFALTWLLNRHWTFEEGRKRKAAPQLVLYLLVQLAGFMVNYGIYALLVVGSAFIYERPWLALAAGSIAALFVTFTLSRLIAFAGPDNR